MKTFPLSAFALLVTLLTISQLALAQSPELEALVESFAAEHVGSSLAGLSVGVARGDQILFQKSYGHANTFIKG